MIGGYDGGRGFIELVGDCQRVGSGERRSHGEGQSRLDVMERLLVADIQNIRRGRVGRI